MMTSLLVVVVEMVAGPLSLAYNPQIMGEKKIITFVDKIFWINVVAVSFKNLDLTSSMN